MFKLEVQSLSGDEAKAILANIDPATVLAASIVALGFNITQAAPKAPAIIAAPPVAEDVAASLAPPAPPTDIVPPGQPVKKRPPRRPKTYTFKNTAPAAATDTILAGPMAVMAKLDAGSTTGAKTTSDAPATASPAAPVTEDIKGIAQAFIAAHGTPALLQKLSKVGARRIGDIAAEKLAAFMEELQDETPKALGV